MSGHSKWHNIQKTKGAQDAKRAAAFTKIAKELIVAVKEGGGIMLVLFPVCLVILRLKMQLPWQIQDVFL